MCLRASSWGRYRDAVRVFLPDTFGFGFPLLERVFILKLGLHADESDSVSDDSGTEAEDRGLALLNRIPERGVVDVVMSDVDRMLSTGLVVYGVVWSG